MKEEFDKYVTDLSLPKVARDRIEVVLAFYDSIGYRDPDGLFISDTAATSDDPRTFNSVWLFQGTAMMEAAQFLSADRFDLVDLHAGIDRWEITRDSFQPDNVVEASRLRVSFTTAGSVSGDMRASGTNTLRLWDVFTRFVVPRISS